MTLDGSNTTNILNTGLRYGTLKGLAVDPVGNKLYFSDLYGRKIEVIGVDGSGRKTFINCTHQPTELTIDLKNSKGSLALRMPIYSTFRPWPLTGKFEDTPGKDAGEHIGCCDYFGTKKQLYNLTGNAGGLAVENDVVYYIQLNTDRHIGSIELKGGRHTRLLNNSGHLSIAILHGECSTSVQALKGDIHHLLGGAELISEFSGVTDGMNYKGDQVVQVSLGMNHGRMDN
ncbi:hypothetical protein LSAT2_007128 [Lamellibrachia satsuma]|nr:hypothetical protein LSAT2_007128 [Lamellibrachia satsuma]